MRVTVDRDGCATSSLCVYNVPEVFDQDERDGRVIVIDADPPDDLYSDVRDAARSCPTQSIRLLDDTED
jgi:ferredoxin